ncbi:DinB family protein [Saccharopolyspora dendranthemae]|uniref:DinB family protein n=1 Tax=Saccharopolyspora dendranthemae TaxID=1181886 RepID=A0A561U4U5_9PSEU|nr:DinB family protein [Saccharopolyspora dendranthemae]TWF94388.1 DinB family protein [Saccharopolyspora dendranthemae]
MPVSRVELLLHQLDITWALFEYHADGLGDAHCLWTPAEHHWTVRPDENGNWVADFQETEPDPVPAVTIGWITWHIDYWWSTVLECLDGDVEAMRSAKHWPGSAQAAVQQLRDLHDRWRAQLSGRSDAELDSTDLTSDLPWGPDMTLGDVAGWVNVELTKNVAEIGALRILQRAQRASSGHR